MKFSKEDSNNSSLEDPQKIENNIQNQMVKELQREYYKLVESLNLSRAKLDPFVAQKHIDLLKDSPYLKGCAISIFDNARQMHVYESDYHKMLFSNADGVYTEMKIHPDDMEGIMKNAIAVMRHIFTKDTASKYSKLIREYRASVRGEYKRIIEEIQILESVDSNRPWLTLSIVNVSPDQNSPFNVVSRLVNIHTGDVFTPPDEYYDNDCILSTRETEILSKISQGMLSKEIADILKISVNTVNNHRQNILRKLKVDNSIEAVRYATTLGLLTI